MFYESLGMQPVMQRMFRRLGAAGERSAAAGPPPARAAVRPAREEDVEPLSRLWGLLAEQARGYPGRVWADQAEVVRYWRERAAGKVNQQDAVLVVVEGEGGQPVGFVEAKASDSAPIFVTGRTGEILNVVMHPEYRRRGLGTGLMTAALEQLRQRGCEDVVLHVDLRNRPAVRFYEKLGLRAVARRMYKRL
jgi:ribosomal protein S18 acetylase RimI-like enzyme